jgi:hypothetical protein
MNIWIRKPSNGFHKLKFGCRIIELYQKKKEYKKIIKEMHKPIPRISRILESGITERIMLPNKGHKIRPLRLK